MKNLFYTEFELVESIENLLENTISTQTSKKYNEKDITTPNFTLKILPHFERSKSFPTLTRQPEHPARATGPYPP